MSQTLESNAQPATAYRLWLLAGLLLLLPAVAYSPLLKCGYIWDDNDYVTENRTLRDVQGLKNIWFKPSATPQYYPLVHSSFWVEYQLWELHPTGYHLTNLALHTLNAFLLWYLLNRLGVPGAWLAAALFAVHPVMVESVAWITERKNVLSGSFYLLAMIAFWNYWRASHAPTDPDHTNSETSQSPVQWLVISYLCFVGALLSKTVTATLPAVILVMIWWQTGRLTARDILRLVPMLILGIGFGLMTVWLEKHQVGASGADWQFTIGQRFLIAGQAIWFYAGKLVWPANLAFIYPRWDIANAPTWHFLFPITVGLVLISLWALRARIGRGPAAAATIFCGTLFPALGFFDVYPMRFSFVADHFQYLASIAILTWIAAGLARLSNQWMTDNPWLGKVAVICGLGTFSALTWNQVHIYQDVETLWYDTLDKNPDCFLAHNNLGAILNRRGEFTEAQLHLRDALRIKPNFIDALINMGKAKEGQQDFSGAMDYYQQAYELNPRFAPAANGLGAMMGVQGNMIGAEKMFREAIVNSPRYSPALINLAAVQESRGELEAAIQTLREAIAVDPDARTAKGKLVAVLLQNGRLLEAKQLIRDLLANSPEDTELIGGLGIIAMQEGIPAEAIKQFERVLEIDPNEVNAILGLIQAHQAAGNQTAAARYEDMLEQLQSKQN